MRPVSSLAPATRFDCDGVRLLTVTDYRAKLLGEEVTKYRHVFVCADGRKLFYTTTKRVGALGFLYNLRATSQAAGTGVRRNANYAPRFNPRPCNTPVDLKGTFRYETR
jgi:hypothetical protein